MLDTVIKGGRVVDGSGSPWYYGDVGISGGKVMELGEVTGEAKRVIDAGSNYVTPGFIDLHSHMDLYLLHDPSDSPKVSQGVTTEVLGNCGLAPAPVSPEKQDMLKFCLDEVLGDFGIPWNWRTLEDYLGQLEPVGVNVCHMVGHIPIRIEVMGGDARAATGPELEEMKGLVREGMEAGAVAFATGLTYHPACFAETREVLELAKVAGEYNGFFSIHQRYWGSRFMTSLDEAVRIGQEAGMPVEFSHVTPFGFLESGTVIEYFNKARREGIDIAYDIIPMYVCETVCRDMLPRWVREGEEMEVVIERLKDPEVRARILHDFENDVELPFPFRGWDAIVVARAVEEKWKEGMSLVEIAGKEDKEPIDAFCDMIVQDRLRTVKRFEAYTDDEFASYLRDPHSLIVSDAFLFGLGNVHLAYGTFAALLGHFIRDRDVVTVQEAVRKMTSYPANKLGLRDRGLLLPEMVADIVIFDLDKVKDTSTVEKAGFPEGIEYVLVNGTVVVEKGESTGALPGKVLRKQ